MPVGQALSNLRTRLRGLAQGPVEEAAVDHIEGLLRAMSGELDEGRRIIRRARATFAEFGLTLTAVATARDEALVERYAGDAAAVERVLRPACDELRRAGEIGSLSMEIGELAEALYELGRYDEADDASREGGALGTGSGRPHRSSGVASARSCSHGGRRREARRLATRRSSGRGEQ